MRLRGTVNLLLARVGYELVRARPSPPPPAPPRLPTPPKPPAAKRLPADYPPETIATWAAVKGRTMAGHNKINFLCDAVRYVDRYAVAGAILECGVWRGGAMMAAARTLLELGSLERDLYLFDTFSGMPEAGAHDVHIWHDQTADDLLTARTQGPPLWEPASLDDVEAGLGSVGYPAERLHLVTGMVEETIPSHAPEQIAILRLDTDWYDSTRHELQHLYPRLVPGGVLIIDDYGSWQGSKLATDEFLDSTGEPLLLTRVGRGRVAIKPGLAPQVRTGCS